MLGTPIGPFVIQKQLGSGAMGTVWLAVHPETKQRVAVKVVAPGLVGNDASMNRFKREVTILKQLSHKNIVRFVASGKLKDGTVFFAMEYIDGEPLDKILERRKRIPWKEVIELGKQLCAALLHAHHQGIVHRDLKPSNLMILKNGTLKLTDFGIAKDFDATALTQANRTVGTAAYMSPEQCLGTKDITQKSDLYSMGIVFYELLTGRKPFHAETVLDMFNQHLSASFESPSRLNMEIPIWFNTLVCQLLEKEPDKRPYDADTVAQALQRIEEKAEAQASAAMDRAKSRAIDRTDLMPGLDDADKEMLKILTKKDKKKRKKKKPLVKRGWFQGLILSVVLLGIVYVIYSAMFKAPSAASLYSQVERSMTREWDDRRLVRNEQIPEFFRYYPKHDLTPKVQELTDKIDMEQATRWLNLNKSDDSVKIALDAIDLEKLGKLEEAEKRWDELFPLKQKTDPMERPLGVLADKYKADYKRVREIPTGLRLKIVGKAEKDIKGESEFEDLALKATSQEHYAKKPAEARVLWDDLRKLAKDVEGPNRTWYLLGAWKSYSLSPPPEKKETSEKK